MRVNAMSGIANSLRQGSCGGRSMGNWFWHSAKAAEVRPGVKKCTKFPEPTPKQMTELLDLRQSIAVLRVRPLFVHKGRRHVLK